jgi:hypothetical protein
MILILFGHLTSLKDDQVARKHYSGYVCEHVSQKRLAFEFVDRVNKMTLVHMDGHQPIC